MSAGIRADAPEEWSPDTRLVDLLLKEQQTLSAVDVFSEAHAQLPHDRTHYETLIPNRLPEAEEQFAFRVDLDACTGCKACVTACHSLNGLEEEETWRNVGLVETIPDEGPRRRRASANRDLRLPSLRRPGLHGGVSRPGLRQG